MFGFFNCKKEKTFKLEEINVLIQYIKEFNAGCIDDYLSKHVDNVYEKWQKEMTCEDKSK